MHRLKMRRPHEDLRREENLYDITLVCEGGQLKAHKLILQSHSRFFREVFAANPPNLSLMYLRGVERHDMMSLLDAMYLGYADVSDTDLQSFIDLGKDLKVRDDLFRDDHVPSSPSFTRPMHAMPPPTAYLRRPRSRNEAPRLKKRKFPEERKYKCRFYGEHCRYKGDQANVYLHMKNEHNFRLNASQREVIDNARTYIVGGSASRRFVQPETATSQAVYQDEFIENEEEPEEEFDTASTYIVDGHEAPEVAISQVSYMEVVEEHREEFNEEANDFYNEIMNENEVIENEMPPPPPRTDKMHNSDARNAHKVVAEVRDDLTSEAIQAKAVLIPGPGKKKYRCDDCSSFVGTKAGVWTHWQDVHQEK